MSEHENVSEKLLRAEYGLQIESLSNVKKSVTFERPARLFETKCAGTVSIGFCSYVNEGFVKNTTIGRYCCIASVMIGAPAHPTDWLSVNQFQYAGGYFKSDPVAEGIYSDVPFTGNGRRTAIGNDVWIGQNAVVMQGVKIGDGAIVAANAVVTKDVAPYSIVGGVPARHIRYRFSEEVIARLLNLRWWRYLLPASLKLPFDQIERCLDRIENLKAAGELALNKPQTYVLQRVGKTYEVSKKKPKPRPSEAA